MSEPAVPASTLRVAWTGHQPAYFADPLAAEAAVAARAAALQVAHGAGLAFFCGGQRGVDTCAARAALRLSLLLHLCLPLPPAVFAADWSPDDIAVLEETCVRAASLTVIDPTGTRGAAAYRERNRWLVAHADLLIAVWTGLDGGGTAETIALARELGRTVEEQLLAGSGRQPGAGERGV